MPNNTNRILRRIDFLHDFNNYWTGTIVGCKGCPFRISEAWTKENVGTAQNYSDLMVAGSVIDGPKGRWKKVTVQGDELTYEFPQLGFVHTGDGWAYIFRIPQRKMTKGYSVHTVGAFLLEPQLGGRVDVCSESIVRQLFFGNSDRINSELVITKDRKVWYGMEHVLNIKDDGTIEVTENHEKMGAIVCKYLANSSASRAMVPNLTLPS